MECGAHFRQLDLMGEEEGGGVRKQEGRGSNGMKDSLRSQHHQILARYLTCTPSSPPPSPPHLLPLAHTCTADRS